MHPVVAIALKDLRQRLRDRSVWVLGFAAPLMVAALISLAFGGAQAFHTSVAVVDEDHGAIAAGFAQFLSSPDLHGLLTVRTVSGTDDARAKVADGTLGAAYVIPAGFSDAVTAGRSRPITVLASVDATVAAQVARALAQSFTAHLEGVQLSVRTAVAAGAPPSAVAALAAQASTRELPAQAQPRASGAKTLTAVSYYAPAMGTFFMFFAIGFGSRGWFLERSGGTLERLAVAPLGMGAVLVGKSLATFVYGAASLGTVALVSSLAFGADWGPPPVVVALVLALALTLVGLTALVITLARTERQAEGIASIITFGLVLLGGNFVFISQAPDAVRTLSRLTPNGWALRAFTDLSGGASWTAAVVPLLAVLAFAAGTALVAFLLRGRVLAR
ncbi:ABC transporter permease [Pedococcus sp. NPDC057267]|uniref:ABC transporter permease n=1 Tax=Pedococcus sp. NPDC057267 TaxID=3346077 RepID=UPI003627E749